MKNSIAFSGQTPDAVLKIVLVGTTNTGKTSLLMRFVDEGFQDTYMNTVGVDFKMKTL